MAHEPLRRPDENPLVAAARAAGVRDARVLATLRDIPRELFVPTADAAAARVDEPIRLPHGLVTTQPSLAALMIEALDLIGEETVLEVGTGYGYQTALLARLARQVWSIEWWPDLAAAARENLARADVRNAFVKVGDGTAGLLAHAPYHAIVVSAAAPAVPAALVDQLTNGGRLVQPIGWGGQEQVRLFVKTGATIAVRRDLIAARFVPLVGRFGVERGNGRGPSPALD